MRSRQTNLLRSLDQLEISIESHTDRQPDMAYHRALLPSGVLLEYDHHFRSHLKDGNCPTVDLIAALAHEFPRQIVVGMDLARRSY